MRIKYYQDYLSDKLLQHLGAEGKPHSVVKDLIEVGRGGGLESTESLQFLCDLFSKVRAHLNAVLEQRAKDREFIDQRVKALYQFNRDMGIEFTSEDYQTILGLKDSDGRIVMGPHQKKYYEGRGKDVSSIPSFLQGHHVTLFGPPDSAKMAINAMNAFHRKLPQEPKIIEDLLSSHSGVPKWGADDEDSKTPLRVDLAEAGKNLTECFKGTIELKEKGKEYKLASDHLSLPIKRFPGLALPCSFLLYRGEPLPLHLYDFALHFFHNWDNPEALSFYVPKLENEEEAAYIKFMLSTAEDMIQAIYPEYQPGNIRLLIVLENPRAVFRLNEMMDELYPYFAGASLGWHDYLGSTARIFKEDGNYRIPVKADPDIVINHIKGSHQLLSNVVGPRGGIKIGGMYGILPLSNDQESESFQVAMQGFFKDVITQLKRGLDGFWVAHPDFMRLGMAIVESWKVWLTGDQAKLETLVKQLLLPDYQKSVLDFIHGEDIKGLDFSDKLYDRALIVADINESTFIANNDPEEVRYNVFQALQYLTDWLCGNGCVALPALVGGKSVRVMDDLATCERSRWEVWHEVYHGRFAAEDFIKIAHEEMNFIRRDLSNEKKIVQVKYDERTSKWYPIAFNLMLKLVLDPNPVEFATELLLPFTIPSIRDDSDPWAQVLKWEARKYPLPNYLERFNHFFEKCGSVSFAQKMANSAATDLSEVVKLISNFSLEEIKSAASFHGDIGQEKKSLDVMAAKEQSGVHKEADQLIILGNQYKQKFGVKFLISAQGKSGQEMLEQLKARLNNSEEQELAHARLALTEITLKRLNQNPVDQVIEKIEDLRMKDGIHSLGVGINTSVCHSQQLYFGEAKEDSLWQMASLSKTVASHFALGFFRKKNIPLTTCVNSLLNDFKLKGKWGDEIQIHHLLSHSGLNLHYVNGVPAQKEMPPISEFLNGNKKYGYPELEVLFRPGTQFRYSGGGFLLLEYLIEQISGKKIENLLEEYQGITFKLDQIDSSNCIPGQLDNNQTVRLNFPRLAAGGYTSTEGFCKFLQNLTTSYEQGNENVVNMMLATDKGSVDFMGAKMGLGVFIAEAGENRFALHQGANDGYRSMFLQCISGPDQGKGFCLFCNADNKGVSFLSKVAQLLLKEMKFSGIDFNKFKNDVELTGVPQEELVNFGYKERVFNSFLPDLPEKIISQKKELIKGPKNIFEQAQLIKVSNQKFARAENITSPYRPEFDPKAFGKQGKIMDSWESARHNPEECDFAILKLTRPGSPKSASFSTEYHLGNQVEQVSLYALKDDEWIEILSPTSLTGHSLKQVKLDRLVDNVDRIKVCIYPDGGLSRVGLYEEEVASLEESFSEPIPATKKPMHLEFVESGKRLRSYPIDVASKLNGGKVLSSSNEHYGPAEQVISPYPPLNMFDGLESARSRAKDHVENVIIEFEKPTIIDRIELDFSFFKNNNPDYIKMKGLAKQGWVDLLEKTRSKGYAGKIWKISPSFTEQVSQLEVICFPDGGINRIRVYSK